MSYVLFLVGFAVLIKGADVLVEGSADVARRLRISDLVVGLTIVAFGTSAPELTVSLLANLKGRPDLTVGNVIGSNVINVLLVLGVAALLRPLTVARSALRVQIPFSLLAVVVLGILANDAPLGRAGRSELSRADGLTLLVFLAVFFGYIFYSLRSGRSLGVRAPAMPGGRSPLFSAGLIVLGLAGLFFGGQWVVAGAVEIARRFHLSESLIGLTIIAVGTSLPELATSVVAALKKNSDIAIGNIVGSNIMNIFWILGASAAVNPIPLRIGTWTARTNVDLLVCLLSGLLLFALPFLNKDRRLTRSHGFVLVLGYVLYTIYLFVRD
jgi:cation:H+ antiporter